MEGVRHLLINRPFIETIIERRWWRVAVTGMSRDIPAVFQQTVALGQPSEDPCPQLSRDLLGSHGVPFFFPVVANDDKMAHLLLFCSLVLPESPGTAAPLCTHSRHWPGGRPV